MNVVLIVKLIISLLSIVLLQVLCLVPHATTSTFPTGDWKATLSVSNASRINVSTNHYSCMVKTTSIEAHRDTFFCDMN